MKHTDCNFAGAVARGDRFPGRGPGRPAAPAFGRRASLGALAIAAGLAGTPAIAALGQGVATVEADRMQVRATVRQVSHASYTVHELTDPMNGLVREYVAPGGQVFAVTWHGPTMPNLQQIMGVHFDTLANIRHQPGARTHVAAQSGNLVFESAGHLRSFHGRAYLADAIPAGVTADDIQ